jgi:hypothetical protein
MLVACTSYYLRQPIAGPQDYVHATITSIARGDLSAAEDLLQRALNRFPEDANVRLWKVRLDLMQWREEEALASLQELSRNGDALVLSQKELKGRIGDVLFQMGRYWESMEYLVAGSVGVHKQARSARAKIAPRLPYARPRVAITTVEMPLLEGELPEMVCRFGDKTESLVLDTGTSMTTLTKTLGKELGVTDLVDQGLARDSMGQPFAAWLGVLPAFTLGAVDLGPQPVLVVEDDRMAMRDPQGGPKRPRAGVVGLDVLSRFRTTFDPDRQSVVFENPHKIPDRHAEPLVVNAGCLQLPVLIEGVKMWFILDTGASHTSLTNEGLLALPGGKARATIERRYNRALGGKAVIVREVPDLTIQVSSLPFAGMTLPVVDRPHAGFPLHGVLGADLLTRCRVTIDRGWVTVSRRGPKRARRD